MAILAMFTGTMNESLRQEVNWEKNLAPGGVFHAAAFDEADGIHAVDVWESARWMHLSDSGCCRP